MFTCSNCFFRCILYSNLLLSLKTFKVSTEADLYKVKVGCTAESQSEPELQCVLWNSSRQLWTPEKALSSTFKWENGHSSTKIVYGNFQKVSLTAMAQSTECWCSLYAVWISPSLKIKTKKPLMVNREAT